MARAARKTVLVSCEGKADLALITYLRDQYTANRPELPRVTGKQAGGKGGSNVLEHLFRSAAYAEYDKLAALLDTDEPPSDKLRRQAKEKRVQIVEMAPCLEGFLLKVLGKSVPVSSAECKQRLRAIDDRDPFANGFFEKNFPRQFLDIRRKGVKELDALLKLFGV